MKKMCEHAITYMGELRPDYAGPLFVCSECGQEWRFMDISHEISRNVAYVHVLREIANEDNVWIDPAKAAQEVIARWPA